MAKLRKIVTLLEPGTPQSRRLYDAAYHHRIDAAMRTHDFPSSKPGGTAVKLEYADPAELLRITLESSQPLQQVYSEAFAKYPGTEDRPWHMTVSFDEIVPGNKLCGMNSRKSMNFIFNFLELGAHVLPITATWVCPLVVRSTLLKQIDGGWSNVCGYMLKRLVLASENFLKGVAIEVNGTCRLLHARLQHIVCDGDALRSTMCWNGAGGVRCCIKHSNVLKKDHASLAHASGFVDVCCHDASLFDVTSEDDFHLAAEFLQQAHA